MTILKLSVSADCGGRQTVDVQAHACGGMCMFLVQMFKCSLTERKVLKHELRDIPKTVVLEASSRHIFVGIFCGGPQESNHCYFGRMVIHFGIGVFMY